FSLAEGKETEVCLAPSGAKTVSLGVGAKSEINIRKCILIARRIIQTAKSHKIKKIALDFNEFHFQSLNLSAAELAELLGVNFEMANFEFLKYKNPPDGGWSLIEEIVITGADSKEVSEGLRKGQIIGEELNKARTLANTPGGDMTPGILADEAVKAAQGLPIKVSALGVKELEELKMGALLGVAKGSDHEPRFIIMEYHGGGAEKPIILVGKGVTFDTGGLNLKPSDGILEMHMDMSGGAAVIHAIAAAARLEIKKNVVALVPAAENMVSGSSYRPGDILTAMSGKTIEVLNTDAEGRLILADALTYAKRYEPRLVVDVATLTGAAMVALGQKACAIMTKDKKLEDLFRELGETSGDYVWPLPLWEEYEEDIKGTFADIANIGKNKYGGAIIGGMFLYQFAKDYPWAHIDMAPRMTAVEGDYLAKGAAGSPVRLLVKLLEEY
ncbi:MAG: leucyl aminopeptidase, partial [Parcubacteria group bacterium]|nr:leucyl aminopeptidase [Parcubacteria group bacterium]